MVHRVISNFKAYVEGAFHGLPKAHMHSLRTHSAKDTATGILLMLGADLLHGMCLMHIPPAGIATTSTLQPKLSKQLTVHGA